MEWNCKGVFGIVAVACLSSVAWCDPITIAPMTEDLYTVSSVVNVPGVGQFDFYSLSQVPTTNIDHTIRLLAGGTLNAVGDSLTLPIELTSLTLSRSPYGSNPEPLELTTNGTQPVGSITIDYTRANEGGTFTATLPVDLVYMPNGNSNPAADTTFTDTLQLQGNWSIFGPIWYPNPAYASHPPNGFYIGDVNNNRQQFGEVGTDVNDVGYLAGPEPGTFGLLGVSLLAGLVVVKRTRFRARS